jgi:hypothetical protein
MEQDTIDNMVKFRVDHPDYFFVSPLVINNALCTYLLQVRGKINLSHYCISDSFSAVLWRNANFANSLHLWFINHIKQNLIMDAGKVNERIQQYKSEGCACVYLYTKTIGKIALLFDWELYELSFDCDTDDNTLNVYFTDNGGNKELAYNISCDDIAVISKFNI